MTMALSLRSGASTRPSVVVLRLFTTGLLFGLLACGDPNRAANEEFVTLSQEISKATAEPDPIARHRALTAARARLDAFLSTHAQSNAAVRIAANEKIGPLTRSELQQAADAASQHPALCRAGPTKACLADAIVAEFDASSEPLKQWMGSSGMAVLAKAGEAERLERLRTFAQTARANEKLNDRSIRPNGLVTSLYLADAIRRSPATFWSEAVPTIGAQLGDAFRLEALKLGSERLLGPGVKAADLGSFDQVVALAPPDIRDEAQKTSAYTRSTAIGRLAADDLVANLDKLSSADLEKLPDASTASLGSADKDRLLDRWPIEKLHTYTYKLQGAGRAAIERALDRASSNSAVQQEIAAWLLRDHGPSLAAETFLRHAALISAAQRCSHLERDVIARLRTDRTAALVLSRALLANPGCNQSLGRTLVALSESGFTGPNVAALREVMAKNTALIGYCPFMPLAITSNGAFPVRDVIDRLFAWATDPSTLDARASLVLDYEAQRLDREAKFISPVFSDEDAEYFARAALKINDKTRISSTNLINYAPRLRAREQDRLADEIEAVAVRNDPNNFNVARQIWVPRLKGLIADRMANEAASRLLKVQEEVRWGVLVDVVYAFNSSSLPLREFLDEVGRRDPILLGLAVRNIGQGREEIFMNYFDFIAAYEKSKGGDVSRYFSTYIGVLWRNLERDKLLNLFFSTKDPIVKAATAYSLMDKVPN